MNFTIDKNASVARMAIYTPQGRKRFSFSTTIITEKENRKLRNSLEDLYEELERFTKTGRELSTEANKTLDQVKAKYPKVYEKTIRDCGLITDDELTLKKAFDEYIEANFDNRSTTKKWSITRDLLVDEFGEYKPLQKIKAIDLTRLFKKLKKKYAPATVQKHLQRTKQLWLYYQNGGEITINPARAVKVTFAKEQLVANKPYIEMETFAKAANCISSQQQKTLLFYYRCMGARQNDPRGDRWEDIDWDKRNINRSQQKGVKKKIGWCPIRPELYEELVKWRDEVIEAKGKAEGVIFPWLFETTSANQRKYFVSRIEAHPTVEVWPNFFNSLRASAVTDIRNTDGIDGRWLASQWIGHNATTADKHYAHVRPKNFKAITKHDQDDEKEVA